MMDKEVLDKVLEGLRKKDEEKKKKKRKKIDDEDGTIAKPVQVIGSY